MNPIHVTPKIEELRRLKKILDRQIGSRTADLNKVNESLREEITKLKRKLAEQEARVQEQAAERARAQESLEESERRYHVMADATPVFIWQSGVDKLCTYFNRGWLEFTGRSMEQELGNGWAEGVHPQDLRRCLEIYASAFERRQPFVMEYRLRHRSGDYRWVLDHGGPIYGSGATFLGYIGGCIDIHDRKLAEEALHRSRQELRALAARLQAVREKERAVLAREMHDELSGTLTALKMDLSLLPDRVAKDHKLFLEKLESMSGLIDSTLDRVHAIVTALRPVVLDEFGLVAAIEWQAGEFQDRWGIVCETLLPTDELRLDPNRSIAIFRILQEALTNVARHARATRVVVDLKSETGNLILTVCDNGKGIDDNAIAAHSSIGLLGMRERALSFGGVTEITSPPEGGTLVSVRIPYAKHRRK
jgi:PAS domain S-box-containing protein